MGIEKIDKNFELKRKIVTGDVDVYDIPSDNFSLHGIFYDEQEKRFTRMDEQVAQKVSEGVSVLSKHLTGGRLRFATNSAVLRLAATYDVAYIMTQMPMTGANGFSLFEETENEENFVGNLVPCLADKNGLSDQDGFVAETQLKGEGLRQYTLYFPLYNDIRSISLAFEKGAIVQKGKPYRNVAPILYYGSSITQGGCASRPDNSYQALICKRNDIDFINLGFSGNAKAEDEIVDYLATIDCSLFVCDYDHNAPTVEYLQNTHYRLYQRYREKRPTTPILFLSKPDFTGEETCVARRKIIRDTYLKAKKQGDANVYFLSGQSFYGKRNRWDFSVDGCHPTDYGFAIMAEKIYKKMIQINQIFKG